MTDSSGDFLIRGGRIVDPAAGTDQIGDLYITQGRTAPVPNPLPAGVRIMEAAGMLVAPGFIDLHVHLREPGGEAAETIASGCAAAARGGFTTILAMPNTTPPTDTPERVQFVLRRAAQIGLTDVRVAACLTAGRSGAQVADLRALAAAGAVAFSDDGRTVPGDGEMRSAMRLAAELGLPVVDHAQDPAAEAQGVMNAGPRAAELGLPGIPAEAEERIIARDIQLAAETGCALHIQHVTTCSGVNLIRAARGRGLCVTGEATPHHLMFSEDDIAGDDTDFKMNPPLRSAVDRAALRAAVADGTLTVLATDHAPHTAEAKARGWLRAPFGVIGLETAIGATWTVLVRGCGLTVLEWVRRWTTGPAAVLGMSPPSLAIGAPANVVLIDVQTEWTVRPEEFVSLSRNTPFKGQRLTGRAAATFFNGRHVHP